MALFNAVRGWRAYRAIYLLSYLLPAAIAGLIFSLLLGWLLMAAGPLSAAGIIGGQLFATGGNVTVEVLPASAGYTSELHLISPGPDRFIALNHDVGTVVNLGSFTAGVELVFGIYVRDTGDTFQMGPASRNPDGIEHAGVENTGPGVAIVGFEDLLRGGDLDYDDNVFKFKKQLTDDKSFLDFALMLSDFVEEKKIERIEKEFNERF